jgi:hypothetical protein
MWSGFATPEEKNGIYLICRTKKRSKKSLLFLHALYNDFIFLEKIWLDNVMNGTASRNICHAPYL